MLVSSEKYLSIFEQATPAGDSRRALRQGLKGYRCKTYKAGPRLECEIFPIWDTRSQVRAAKKHMSRPAQIRLNAWNRQKVIARYLNANFYAGDFWGTFTYDDAHLPKSDEEAQKNIANFIRCIKRRAKKKGIELRYLYVTGGDRYHHHLVISAGLDRTEIEQLWKGGGRTQMRILQPDKMGLTGLAMYIGQGKNIKKRWGHSQNLRYPKPTVADGKITRRRAEKLALAESEARAFFERAYPGYAFGDMRARYSPYVAGVYLYIEMWREDRGMDEVEQWLEETGQVLIHEGERVVQRYGAEQLFRASTNQLDHWMRQGMPVGKKRIEGRWKNVYPIERCRAWFAGEGKPERRRR